MKKIIYGLQLCIKWLVNPGLGLRAINNGELMLPITQDITKAVLFSGGINSTGICYWLEEQNQKYCCINLVVNYTNYTSYPWVRQQRYQSEVCRNFCNTHNIPLIEVYFNVTNTQSMDMVIPTDEKPISWLGGVASFISLEYPQLTHIYYGSSVEDFEKHDPTAKLNSIVQAAGGTAVVELPLKTQNKHYIHTYTIKDDFRDNTTSCWNHYQLLSPRYCKLCYKCNMLKTLNII
jgi:7-cyano-7-deazaguanine synthase in queuosine biosynthesis